MNGGATPRGQVVDRFAFAERAAFWGTLGILTAALIITSDRL